MVKIPPLSKIREASIGEANGFDIIGDIHGCAQSLERLLEQMGYKKIRGIYQHVSRQVIFLGDIVDRGPRIREALALVHGMVERGSALMILGNHEVNALTYCTPKTPGSNDFLRQHNAHNNRQIAETLAQFADYPQEWRDYLTWFRTLPLYLEMTHPVNNQVFRAVHACWDQELINIYEQHYGGNGISDAFLRQSVLLNTPAALIKQRLTGGVDLRLPEGIVIRSEDGNTRRAFRTKFWANEARTYGELLFQPDPLPEDIAKAQISAEDRARMVHYGANEPPLFVGHYWLKGQPRPLMPNLACLDYSAVKYGRLVAYRMDGEAQLRPEKFVWVYVDP
jgi:hypothetical protein